MIVHTKLDHSGVRFGGMVRVRVSWFDVVDGLDVIIGLGKIGLNKKFPSALYSGPSLGRGTDLPLIQEVQLAHHDALPLAPLVLIRERLVRGHQLEHDLHTRPWAAPPPHT